MLEISANLQIPDSELSERFVRSSGPGGQNVNKVSTAVELRFDIRGSLALTEALREKLLNTRDRRINEAGELVIMAQRFRSQDRNREDARDRLVTIIRNAMVVKKKRVATKPTRASKERRIKAKTVRAKIKDKRSVRNWENH